MTFTVVFSAKNKAGLDVYSTGLNELELPEGQGRRFIGATDGTYDLLAARVPVISGYDALMDSPLREMAQKLGDGPEAREERTQLLALLVLINGRLPGYPHFDMVVGNPTPLADKVKKRPEAEVSRMSDASGLSLLGNGLRAGCIVVPHHNLYPVVLEWLRQGRPNTAAMHERLQAETDLVLAFHHMDNYRFLQERATK